MTSLPISESLSNETYSSKYRNELYEVQTVFNMCGVFKSTAFNSLFFNLKSTSGFSTLPGGGKKRKNRERHFLYECFLLAPVCITIHLPWWRASVNWSLIWISPEELEEKAMKKLQQLQCLKCRTPENKKDSLCRMKSTCCVLQCIIQECNSYQKQMKSKIYMEIKYKIYMAEELWAFGEANSTLVLDLGCIQICLSYMCRFFLVFSP